MGRHADEADNQQMSARRVLLAPVESAGVAGAIRDGLRARGVQADLWTITPHPFVETEDRLLTGYLARARAGLIAGPHRSCGLSCCWPQELRPCGA